MRKIIVQEFLDQNDVEQMIDDAVAGITKETVGLGEVDNTADVDKPVSAQQQAALDSKADAEHTHGIDEVVGLQSALDGKADADHDHGNFYVKSEELAAVATTGSYNDLTDQPDIPEQFNPIAGDNISITGTYPDITFAATASGGGGAVDSVNGQTGDVVLTAGDVGASPEDHYHAGDGDFSTAVGFGVSASHHGTALGREASAGGFATAVGRDAMAGGFATAVGRESSAGDLFATAVGSNATGAGEYATAVGFGANAGEYATAVGYGANAGDYAIAVGFAAKAVDPGTAAMTAHTLTLEPRDGSGAESQEPGSIQMYNSAGDLVSISVDANNELVVTPVE